MYQGEHAPDGNSAMESNDPRTSSTSTASNTASRVVWLSLPYFFLDLYSGQAAGEGHNRSFPPLTLLQVQYSGNSRDRDMTQAICRLGLVPRGWCYHIGQLWAMVVDDGQYSVDPSSRNNQSCTGHVLTSLWPQPFSSRVVP